MSKSKFEAVTSEILRNHNKQMRNLVLEEAALVADSATFDVNCTVLGLKIAEKKKVELVGQTIGRAIRRLKR